MRNLLVMGAVGAALVCVTVGGLLGAQGRLNYEGTRHIPLLNSLFSAPEEAPVTRKPSTRNSPAREATVTPNVVTQTKSALRKKERATDSAELPRLSGMPAARGFGSGELFDLRRLEAIGLTVDDVNAIVEQARKDRQAAAAERSELYRLRRGLEVRERDVAERHARLAKLMDDVVTERKRVEQAIQDFNERVTELRIDEVAALEETARTIGKLTPAAGAELIVEFWQGEDGPNKVVKILAVMNKDRADEILAHLDTRRAREILEKRMTVIRTGGRGTGISK